MRYNISGTTVQYLNIELDPGESVYCDTGYLVSKSASVVMSPRLVGGILGAIKREITGATGFLTVFEAKGDRGLLTVSNDLPGKIIAIELNEGESIVLEDRAFLLATSNVSFNTQRVSLSAAFFTNTGLFLQKFNGPGVVFAHIVGDLIEHDLKEGDEIQIDPGHLAGFTPSLSYTVSTVGNIRSALFGGVGIFLMSFRGNGKLLLHSISRYKLTADILGSGNK
ncbi:MAG: hypothetical protein ARM1_0422 [Candidatus Micrarchaeota archaeon]|nr:MAG: hypothetical protein ARM1_0422 [Candidatus Micrarchaeota archaeon]